MFSIFISAFFLPVCFHSWQEKKSFWSSFEPTGIDNKALLSYCKIVINNMFLQTIREELKTKSLRSLKKLHQIHHRDTGWRRLVDILNQNSIACKYTILTASLNCNLHFHHTAVNQSLWNADNDKPIHAYLCRMWLHFTFESFQVRGSV